MTESATHQFQWTINGIYANWTMTITAAPPDHPAPSELIEFPKAAFGNLTRNFAESVNLYEATHDHENSQSARDLDHRHGP